MALGLEKTRQEGSYQNMERKTKKEPALGLKREMQPGQDHPIASDGGMPSTSTSGHPIGQISEKPEDKIIQRSLWSPEQLENAGKGLSKVKGKYLPRNLSALCPAMAVMRGHRCREAWNAGLLLGGHRSRRVAGSTNNFTRARNDLVLSQ